MYTTDSEEATPTITTFQALVTSPEMPTITIFQALVTSPEVDSSTAIQSEEASTTTTNEAEDVTITAFQAVFPQTYDENNNGQVDDPTNGIFYIRISRKSSYPPPKDMKNLYY